MPTNIIDGVEREREEFLLANDGLIHHVAKRYKKRLDSLNVDYDDIFNLGFIGAMKAFDNFDDSYGFKFTTYAVPMINGEIQRYLRDKDTSIKFSRSIKELAYKISKEGLNDEAPEVIAKKLETSKEKVLDAITFMINRNPISTGKVMFDGKDGDSEITLEETLESVSDYTGIMVDEFISSLDERLQKVLALIIQDKTQNEIGEALGVSQVQVSRLLRKIRQLYIDYSTPQSDPVNEQVTKRIERKAIVKKPTVQKPIDKGEVVNMSKGKINPQRLNGLTVEKYKEMRRKGYNNREIMEQFNLYKNVYTAWKKQEGLTGDSPRGIHANKENKAKAKENRVGYPKASEQLAGDAEKLEAALKNKNKQYLEMMELLKRAEGKLASVTEELIGTQQKYEEANEAANGYQRELNLKLAQLEKISQQSDQNNQDKLEALADLRKANEKIERLIVRNAELATETEKQQEELETLKQASVYEKLAALENVVKLYI